MAKTVTKATAAKAAKPTAESRKIAGVGFSKSFTQAELKEISVKRQEMRSRLFASG